MDLNALPLPAREGSRRKEPSLLGVGGQVPEPQLGKEDLAGWGLPEGQREEDNRPEERQCPLLTVGGWRSRERKPLSGGRGRF